MSIDLMPGFGAFTQSTLLNGSESDGTNLLTGGSGMTSDWDISNATLTNAAAIAPDGTTTASSLIENSANNRHITFQDYTGAALGAFRLSVYAKQITRRYIVLYATDSDVQTAGVYVDLQTGTITDTNVSGTMTLSSTSIASGANGFWKITMEANFGASETGDRYLVIVLSPVDTYGVPLVNDNPSYTGDGTSGVYLWRPKLVDI